MRNAEAIGGACGHDLGEFGPEQPGVGSGEEQRNAQAHLA